MCASLLPLPPPEPYRGGTGCSVLLPHSTASQGESEAGPGSARERQGPGPRAQEGRLGGRCPRGRAKAASASSSLAAPARGPAGLGSQSPAIGLPGTRLGRDGGCAKAAEVPAAVSNNPHPPKLHHPPIFFLTSAPGRPESAPLGIHPPKRVWKECILATHTSLQPGSQRIRNAIASLPLDLLHTWSLIGSIS